jgi:hypothetical protein
MGHEEPIAATTLLGLGIDQRLLGDLRHCTELVQEASGAVGMERRARGHFALDNGSPWVP